MSRLRPNELQLRVKGEIIVPGDAGYDEARQVWNAMIDRRPALIVRCAEASDVPPAVAFAREHHLDISIRGGGHNIAGTAVCDGGVVVDLSRMTAVSVDPQRRRAIVQPGATLAQVDVRPRRMGWPRPSGSTPPPASRA